MASKLEAAKARHAAPMDMQGFGSLGCVDAQSAGLPKKMHSAGYGAFLSSVQQVKCQWLIHGFFSCLSGVVPRTPWQRLRGVCKRCVVVASLNLNLSRFVLAR
jgi:hypothetical protein